MRLVGTIIPLPRPPAGEKLISFTWDQSIAATLTSHHAVPPSTNVFNRARAVVACSGDVVSIGEFALARIEGVSELLLYRL